MLRTVFLVLMAMVNYVSPIPVPKGENEDIEVMKCIVEVIADALSRPYPLPVSQHCLDTLRTDERLVSILRHRNFLKELQAIAVEGANERAQLTEGQTSMTGQVTKLPQDAPEDLESNPDRSMLLAGMRPGEKRGTEVEEEGEEESTEREATESRESQEGNEIEHKEQDRNKEEQNPSNHISDSMNQGSKSEEKGEMADTETEEEKEEKEEEEEKKQSSSAEEEEYEDEKTLAQNGKVSDGQGETSEAKPSAEEDKRTASDTTEGERKKEHVGEEEEEEEEEEGEKRDISAKTWSRLIHQPRGLQAQGRAKVEQEEEVEEEEERRSSEYKQHQGMPPHHSKEASPEEEATREVQHSPEETELRMMARREPEPRDEEGSASRKTEDPEIESLAAIESELENMAKKLHELRHG